MNAFRALIEIFLADMRRRPGSAAASILAIAAGVAIFVAVRLAGDAARSSFVSAAEAVSGRATHEVTRPGGVDEARLPVFVASRAVRSAQPVVEGHVAVREILRNGKPLEKAAPPLRVFGVDPFLVVSFLGRGGDEPIVDASIFDRFLTEPGATVLSRRWADEVGAQPGDQLRVAVAGRAVSLEVIGIHEFDVLGEAVREIAVVDLATAQEVLDRPGELDRIELVLDDSEIDAVQALLAPGEILGRPAERGERVARMIDAFRLNLLALGSLALVVGALLVFNACQFRVVRRTRLLGQLRCLGVSRPRMLAAVLAEVLLLALVGGVVGIAAGQLLSHRLTSSVGQTITDLYRFIRIDSGTLDPSLALTTLAGTIAVAALAGWLPALEASRTPPHRVGVRSQEETSFRAQLPRLTWLGLGACAIAVTLVALPVGDWWIGVLVALALLLGGACFLPVIMAHAIPLAQNWTERRGWLLVPVSLGAVLRSLSRTGGAAAALGVALAMTLGVIIMVSSFEKEVIRWAESSLQADIYIADRTEKISRRHASIPEAVIDDLRRHPGIASVDTLRGVELPYADRSIFFTGLDLEDTTDIRRFEFLDSDPQAALAALQRGEALVSEPLSRRYDLGVGDRLRVPGRDGEESFEIAAVFRDYSYDRGYAATSRRRFVEAFGDPGVRNVAITVLPQVDVEPLAAELRQRYASRYLLNVRSVSELRNEVLEIFRRTFAVTYLLQTISTFLALVGIGVTVYSLSLERAREIATLRALGATLGQIGRLLMTESVWLALFPVVLAIPLGVLLAWVLIDVINLRAFGWSLPMHWPGREVAVTCALAFLSGVAAALPPLLRLRKLAPAEALREE